MFSADRAGGLWKNGHAIPLQEQPLRVLVLLLERAGSLVSRDELRKALWPANTFVEFDQGLNTAIKKLRQALGDSADNPRFIETLPRKGYRFIAPVSGAGPAVAVLAVEGPAIAAGVAAAEVPAPRSGSALRLVLVAAGIGLVLGGAATAWLLATRNGREEAIAPPVPLTAYPGFSTQPSFSPEGDRVAFVWNGAKGDNLDIYIKQVGVEKPLRLTTDSAQDSRPSWSPDGRLIAFLRELGNDRLGIFVVPSIGSAEKKIFETRTSPFFRNYTPAWTPDSKWLAFPDLDANNPADQTLSIYALSLDTGEKRRLTHAPAGFEDFTGGFSPDGSTLVFKRQTATAGDLYLLRLAADLKPAGEPLRLTSEREFINSPSWVGDRQEIIYVSLGNLSRGTVWRFPARPGAKPTRLIEFGDEVRTLAVSGQAHRLAYERVRADSDIWRMELNRAAGRTAPPVQLIAPGFADGSPAYSPDGKRIAFASSRSGYAELWLSAADGSDPFQLTFLKGRQIGQPHWSRDSRRIFFDCNITGKSGIYVIDSDGKDLRGLTTHAANDAVPNLSADGRWIYFVSNGSGQWEIWKMAADGGEAAWVTGNGGYVAFESSDGKYLYYAKSIDVSGLWRRAVEGGPEEEVAKPVLGNTLTSSDRGIFFARPAPVGRGNEIARYSFATGRTTTVATTPQPVYWFLSVSPDERFLLYTATQNRSNLMLLENFR